LDVVVGIAEDSRLARGVQPVGVDEGMALGGDDSTFSMPMRRRSVGHVVGRFLDVGLMLFERADAGNAEEVFQFV